MVEGPLQRGRGRKSPGIRGFSVWLANSCRRLRPSPVDYVFDKGPRRIRHICQTNALFELIPTHRPAENTDTLVCERWGRRSSLEIKLHSCVGVKDRQYIGSGFDAIRARRQLETIWDHHFKSRSHHHLLPPRQATHHRPASNQEECSYSTLAQAACLDMAFRSHRSGCFRFWSKNIHRTKR